MYKRIALVFAALALLLSACSLSGEPEIVRTAALPTVTPTALPDLGRPPAQVSLGRGAAIFNDPKGCQACHGFDGLFDGPSAPGFDCKPNLVDPASNRGKTILSWFAIASNGNNGASNCLMPPWKGQLTEQQRWDVVSYAYSLRYTPDILAQGAKIWSAQCAACHGDQAAGDGPQAANQPRPVPNLADPAYLIAKSDTELWRAVTDGTANFAAHSYKNKLSDDERWAVVAYARSLTWADVGGSAQATAQPTAQATVTPTPAGTPASATLTVQGKVTDGTTKTALPAGQALTLRVIEQTTTGPTSERFDTTTAADGSFTFPNVPRRIGQTYVIVTTYAGVLQVSTPLNVTEQTGAALDLSFAVYETTSDPSVIQTDVADILIDFVGSGTAVVQEGMRFRNTSDRIFVTGERTASGDPVTLQIDLPPGAQGVTLAQDLMQQYAINGSVVQGVIPITPGDTPLFQVSYLLPLGGDLQFSVPNRYPITTLALNLPESVPFSDPRFVPDKPITLTTGAVYNTYRLRDPLQAGASITFTISLPGGGQRFPLAIVIFVSFLVLALTIFAIWRLNRRDQVSAADNPSDTLIRAIATLDDRYAAGQMSAEEYETQRATLKADLAKLIRRSGE